MRIGADICPCGARRRTCVTYPVRAALMIANRFQDMVREVPSVATRLREAIESRLSADLELDG